MQKLERLLIAAEIEAISTNRKLRLSHKSSGTLSPAVERNQISKQKILNDFTAKRPQIVPP